MAIESQIKAAEADAGSIRYKLGCACGNDYAVCLQTQLAQVMAGLAVLYKARAEIDSLASKWLYRVQMYSFWLFDYTSGDDPAGFTLSSTQFVLALNETQAVYLLWQKYTGEYKVDAGEFAKNAIESIVEVNSKATGVL